MCQPVPLTLLIMDLRAYARAWVAVDRAEKPEDVERTPYTELMDQISLELVRERMRGNAG